MRAETGGNNIVCVCSSTEVDVAKEGFVVLHASDDHVEPQRIEARSAIVQNSRQPSVEIFWLQSNLVVHCEVGEDRLIDELLDELEVCIVAGDSNDDVLIDLENTVDVVVASQVSVRNEQITSDNHSLVVLNCNN